LSAICGYCGFPIANPSECETFCKLCRALEANLRRNPWFVIAHAEWERENIQLARLKRELLGQRI
jgi:hypothetical protein